MTAGKLRFMPKANESGFDSYGTAGVGNRKQDYANFQFAVIDVAGVKSNLATLTIDVTPVADAPVITAATVLPLHSYSETFESYGDIYGATSTTQVNGWTAIAPNQIEILQESTYLGNTSTNRVLEIEGPVGGADVYKDFATYPGELFTLSLSYSPRKGNTTGVDSAIDIYWEGTKIGTLNSSVVGLKTYSFNVTASSANSLSRLQFHAQNSNSTGGVIDNISLVGKGFNMGAAIPLSVGANLTDSDGSESLSLAIQSIPVGAKLTDGTNSFTATTGNTTASLTGWNLNTLKVQPTVTQTASFTLTLVATATESITGTTASTATPIVVNLGTLLVSPIVLDLNGDGIKTTKLGETIGKFDLLNNGTPVESGWLSSEDGFLAIDRNVNGKIDSRAELFGGEVGEGFASLASLDSNGDPLVSQRYSNRFS